MRLKRDRTERKRPTENGGQGIARKSEKHRGFVKVVGISNFPLI